MKLKPLCILIIIIFTIIVLGIFSWINLGKNSNKSIIPTSITTSNQSSGCPCNKSSSNNTNDNGGKVLAEYDKIEEYEVPILMYHYIRDYNDPDDQIGTNLSVSPEEFENDLRWLKKNGYQTVDFRYFDNPYMIHSTSSGQVSNKPIIITFDDGYRDVYTEAFPLLQEYDFTAVFYIITDYPDNNDRYMNWQELAEMKQAGMTIASHTLSHLSLDKQSDDRVKKELIESKTILEEKLEIEIVDFCYPSGKYDERTISALKKYGYKTATTVHSGIANQDFDLFELPRIRMQNNTSLENTLK